MHSELLPFQVSTMSLFLIAIDNAKEAEQVRKCLSDKYNARFYEMENGISWIFQAKGDTALDVGKAVLNSKGDDKKLPKVPGIVVSISTYSGYYDADLWEKMTIWRDEK